MSKDDSLMMDLAFAWVKIRGTRDLDPLQGYRWNAYRSRSANARSLPRWECNAKSNSHLAPRTLEDLANRQLTNNEQVEMGYLLDQHLAVCEDCAQCLEELREGCEESGEPAKLELLVGPACTLACSLPVRFDFSGTNERASAEMVFKADGPRWSGTITLKFLLSIVARTIETEISVSNSELQEAWFRLGVDVIAPIVGAVHLEFKPEERTLIRQLSVCPELSEWCVAVSVSARPSNCPEWLGLVDAATRPSRLEVQSR